MGRREKLCDQDRLGAIRAACRPDAFGEIRSVRELAGRYGVSDTCIRELLRRALSRAVSILEPQGRLTELVSESNER